MIKRILALGARFTPGGAAVSSVAGFLKVFLDPRVWLVCALVGGAGYLKGYWKRGEICAQQMAAGKAQAIAQARERDAKARDVADRQAAAAVEKLSTEKSKLEGELDAFKKLVSEKPDCGWSDAELDRLRN